MNAIQSNTKPIIIAIDGLSSCGKSTLAKDLAKILGYIYIDTGAMYRALTWYMLENHLSPQELIGHLPNIQLSFISENGENKLILNGRDISREIRSKEVNANVSQVSTLPELRHFLVRLQQAMGKDKAIVMDGRDIGTVVFPDAEVKFFITAAPSIRARRRHLENEEKGIPSSYEEVMENLLQRDQIDSSRTVSPLKKAEDAHVIDTSGYSREEQLAHALRIVQSHLKNA